MYSRGGSAPLSTTLTFRTSPSLDNASLHGSPATNGMVTHEEDQGQGKGHSLYSLMLALKAFPRLSNGDKKKPTRGSEGYGRSDKGDMNVDSMQQDRYTGEEVGAIAKGYEVHEARRRERISCRACTASGAGGWA